MSIGEWHMARLKVWCLKTWWTLQAWKQLIVYERLMARSCIYYALLLLISITHRNLKKKSILLLRVSIICEQPHSWYWDHSPNNQLGADQLLNEMMLTNLTIVKSQWAMMLWCTLVLSPNLGLFRLLPWTAVSWLTSRQHYLFKPKQTATKAIKAQ